MTRSSLLLRLHRATTIETDLSEIQANHVTEVRWGSQIQPASREGVFPDRYRCCQARRPITFTSHRRADAVDVDRDLAAKSMTNSEEMLSSGSNSVEPRSTIALILHVASCVLLICPTTHSTASAAMKQPCGARSVKTFLTLDALDRRKPQERGPRLRGAVRCEG